MTDVVDTSGCGHPESIADFMPLSIHTLYSNFPILKLRLGVLCGQRFTTVRTCVCWCGCEVDGHCWERNAESEAGDTGEVHWCDLKHARVLTVCIRVVMMAGIEERRMRGTPYISRTEANRIARTLTCDPTDYTHQRVERIYDM